MPKKTVEIQMRWSDMDLNAHVNNVLFLRYLEEARIRFMTDVWQAQTGDVAVLVAHQEIDYVRPLVYALEPARFDIWISDIGTSRYTFGYEVFDPAGNLCARAESTLVSIDPRTQRATPIPDDVRTELEAHLGEPVALHRRTSGRG
ncbi:thioesterase family protein [Tsukamurella sp. 8F]|uniref:acyl-CoA thioesterase n=1 Tax=unclassified Tsukamurella TaxID=2633480 RepID=UPI0023B8E638|nr:MULTISPECIES: thioesterase family protein [unclassified Tsukamurella]MDF0532296.1 thioesterase family protein [Tsukamurella sp. 8J]MDF0589001.1 thioesterase family protein [Tsukamurella sp. 8F]